MAEQGCYIDEDCGDEQSLNGDAKLASVDQLRGAVTAAKDANDGYLDDDEEDDDAYDDGYGDDQDDEDDEEDDDGGRYATPSIGEGRADDGYGDDDDEGDGDDDGADDGYGDDDDDGDDDGYGDDADDDDDDDDGECSDSGSTAGPVQVKRCGDSLAEDQRSPQKPSTSSPTKSVAGSPSKAADATTPRGAKISITLDSVEQEFVRGFISLPPFPVIAEEALKKMNPLPDVGVLFSKCFPSINLLVTSRGGDRRGVAYRNRVQLSQALQASGEKRICGMLDLPSFPVSYIASREGKLDTSAIVKKMKKKSTRDATRSRSRSKAAGELPPKASLPRRLTPTDTLARAGGINSLIGHGSRLSYVTEKQRTKLAEKKRRASVMSMTPRRKKRDTRSASVVSTMGDHHAQLAAFTLPSTVSMDLSSLQQGIVAAMETAKDDLTEEVADCFDFRGAWCGATDEKAGKVKDWNGRFQQILAMPASDFRSKELYSLAHDFVYAAKTYGKIIISEMHLDVEQQTIKPISAGGVAGGQKYICQNIFFKFATDVLLIPSKPLWMYGGHRRDDAAAMKAAGLDLQGLMSYYDCGVPGLHYPLMALIDHRGYRLIAMSILPLNRDTIVYGSADGGKSVHMSNPDVTSLMQRAGDIMRLKGHEVAGKVVHGPGDIEAHVGTDGKYYVLDFARTFPPEAPSDRTSRAVFYQHLRPEFCRKYACPLSSDAFTRWGKHDKKQHNYEVRVATNFLYESVIPQFARELDEGPDLTGNELVEAMHRSGINLRHCGRVRTECEDPFKCALLLNEMVVRVQKANLNAILRRGMERHRPPLKDREIVLAFLNMLCGNHQPSLCSINPDGYWCVEVKRQLLKLFPFSLSDKELKEEVDLRDILVPRMFFSRLQDVTGIRIRKSVMKELEAVSFMSELQFRFMDADFLGYHVKVKHMSVVDEARALHLMSGASDLMGSQADRQWASVDESFRAAVSTNTNSSKLLFQWSESFMIRGASEANCAKAVVWYRHAMDKCAQAIEINPHFYQCIARLGHIHVELAARCEFGSSEYTENAALAEERFLDAVHLHRPLAVEVFDSAAGRCAGVAQALSTLCGLSAPANVSGASIVAAAKRKAVSEHGVIVKLVAAALYYRIALGPLRAWVRRCEGIDAERMLFSKLRFIEVLHLLSYCYQDSTTCCILREELGHVLESYLGTCVTPTLSDGQYLYICDDSLGFVGAEEEEQPLPRLKKKKKTSKGSRRKRDKERDGKKDREHKKEKEHKKDKEHKKEKESKKDKDKDKDKDGKRKVQSSQLRRSRLGATVHVFRHGAEGSEPFTYVEGYEVALDDHHDMHPLHFTPHIRSGCASEELVNTRNLSTHVLSSTSCELPQHTVNLVLRYPMDWFVLHSLEMVSECEGDLALLPASIEVYVCATRPELAIVVEEGSDAMDTSPAEFGVNVVTFRPETMLSRVSPGEPVPMNLTAVHVGQYLVLRINPRTGGHAKQKLPRIVFKGLHQVSRQTRCLSLLPPREGGAAGPEVAAPHPDLGRVFQQCGVLPGASQIPADEALLSFVEMGFVSPLTRMMVLTHAKHRGQASDKLYRSIRLGGFSGHDNALVSYAAMHLRGVRDVRLSAENKLSNVAVLSLVEHNPSLSSLSLTGCTVVDHTLLKSLAEKCNSLHELRLWSGAGDSAISMLLSFTSLTAVDFSGCGKGFTDKHISTLAKASFFRAIEAVDVSTCVSLTDKGIITLVKYSPSLRSLSLNHCTRLGPACSHSIQQSSSLQELHAANCAAVFTDADVRKICDKGKVQQLSVNGCSQLTGSFLSVLSHSGGCLHSLDLSDCCSLRASSLQVLARNSASLKELLLNYANVNGDFMESLAVNAKRLAFLSLVGCASLKDDEVGELVQCPMLSILILRACSAITHEGVAAVAQAPKMVLVDVVRCGVSTASVLRITKEHPTLTILH